MCGIAGAIDLDPNAARDAVGAMCHQMIARGPDDGGLVLLDAYEAGVALGNRRLAIIDPSPAGHQPMRDDARGTTIVFNGMIYNHRELRETLEGHGERFTSECDTEVVLRAYGRYGAKCVENLRGMFAFAVWDPRYQSLFLARDYLGIKPLYYYEAGSGFMFASQVKSLLATGRLPARISPAGVHSYLSFGAVSEPLTAIEGVMALPAGHTATVSGAHVRVQRYWQPAARSLTVLPRAGVVAELRARLEDSVRRHLISDVPLGIFLSGGLDSSVLAALAARETGRVTTVSVAFEDPQLSERPYMERVARHIGSEHTSVTLSARDLLVDQSEAFEAMDQPTFDGMNTYVVSREAAHAGLKVALSGLGADELFDGYGYASRIAALERAARIPRAVAHGAARVVGIAPMRGNREKLQLWLGGAGEGGSAHELLRRVFLADEVASLAPMTKASEPWGQYEVASLERLSRAAILDLTSYTKNVLLRDTDAMSMAHSVEVRVPYLDRDLVEWVVSLPDGLKRGARKALLAEAVGDLLPTDILTRKKQGFELPLADWMRSELRDEVDATLRRPPDNLAGLLDGGASGRVWNRFLQDGRGWTRPWALFALCRWASTIDARRRIVA